MNNLLSYGKVRLRAVEPGDIDILCEWENDTALWELSNTHAPFSRHLLEQYIRVASNDIYEQKQFRFIFENEEQKPVGAIDLFDFEPYHLRAGVGILVFNDEDRCQGYASDALAALEQYSVNALGLKQLFASIAEDNEASLRLFEKAGFVQSGIMKNWLRTPAGWKNVCFMQRLLIL